MMLTLRGGVALLALLLTAALSPAVAWGEDDSTPVPTDAVAVEEAADTGAAEDAPAEDAPAEDAPAEDAPAEDAPAEDAPEVEEVTAAPRWFRGVFEVEGDAIYTRGRDDLDFSQYLRIFADPPKYPKLHLRGAVWLHQDVGSDRGKPNTLRDINDASSADVQARVLYLHADIDGMLGDQSVVRIGRQRIQEGVAYNRVDGLYAKKRIGQVESYAFIGARASIYRDTSDDLVLGGGVAYIPAPHTRIALDGYYAEESRYGVARNRHSFFLRRYSRPVAPEINDSRVTLSVWHNFGINTRAFARLGMLGGNVDELTLSLNGYVPRIDLLYNIDYRQLFDSTGDTTADLSPFYRVLGQYREHKTLLVGLHRPITQSVTLSLEGEIRDTENDDFYSGNRDYTRAGAILYVEDAFQGFDVTTSLEHWDVSGGQGTWTVTGEISRSWKRVDWRAGVDFVRYKDRVIEYDRNAALLDAALVAFVPGIYPGFSYLTQYRSTRVVDTRENVYSIYTGLDWTLREDQEIFAKVTFEEDDGPDSPYWRIRAGYRIRF